MRPGKPVLFGHLTSGLPILGLPGNPVSACVAALVFLRPAIAVMLGLDPGQHPPGESALHGRDLPANDERQDYLRAGLSRNAAGQLIATPFAQQDSAQLRRLGEADCLVVRPPHAAAARAGETAPILRFEPGC
jgi:molybdopterin molybdotransferase